MITYEQPLTEKIRLFLRLEALVRRFRHHVQTPEPDNTLAAVLILLDLYNLSARIDLKSEVIKEIDRLTHTARVNFKRDDQQDKLQAILTDASQLTDKLYQLTGQLGQHLRDHVFFNSLRQRASLPGGMNGFDIPLLHYWYKQSEEKRLNDLQEWSMSYQIAADAVSFSLNITRDCADVSDEVAKSGFFQMTLDPRKPLQLLQVVLPKSLMFYPEISAGKQRFSLRFLEANMLVGNGKQQIEDDINFDLKLCNF